MIKIKKITSNSNYDNNDRTKIMKQICEGNSEKQDDPVKSLQAKFQRKKNNIQYLPANSQPKISKSYIFTCLSHETYKLGEYYLK